MRRHVARQQPIQTVLMTVLFMIYILQLLLDTVCAIMLDSYICFQDLY